MLSVATALFSEQIGRSFYRAALFGFVCYGLFGCVTQQSSQKAEGTSQIPTKPAQTSDTPKDPIHSTAEQPSPATQTPNASQGSPAVASPEINARLARYYAATRMVVLRYLAAEGVQKARKQGRELRGRIRVRWPTKAALPLLTSQIRDAAKWEERWAAIRLVGELQTHAAPTLPLLFRHMQKSQQPLIQAVIADTFGQMGIVASSVQPLLRKIFSQSPHHEVRASILRALWKIDPTDTDNRAVLTQGIADSHLQVRLMGLIATAALRPYTDDVNDQLVRGLKDPHWLARLTTVASLGRLGMLASSNVPLLQGMLRDPHWQVRLYTARILPQMGPRASLARADLQALQADPHPQVRAAAQQALTQISE